MPQTIVLDEQTAKDKGKIFSKLITGDIKDRTPKIASISRVRDIYFGNQDANLRAIGSGESNIHLPVLAEKIEGIVPKVINAFWNAKPIINVRRIAEEFDPELTKINELFLNWAVEADIPDFYATTEKWFRNMYLDGTSVVKTWWKYKERNTIIRENKKMFWDAGQPNLFGQPIPEARPKMAEEILLEVFGITPRHNELLTVRPVDVNGEELDGSSYRVDFIENRQQYDNIFVQFHASKYVDEIDIYIHRPIVVQNQPIVEVVELEDLIIPYRTDSLQDADRIAHQYWLSLAEIKEKMRPEAEGGDDWNISEEDLEILKAVAKTGDGDRHEQHPENKTLKRQKDTHVGETNTGINPTGEEPFYGTKLLMYEIYTKDNLNGDGDIEEVVYQMPNALQKIVKTNYLEELFPHGRRPFADIHNILVSDRYYSQSYGELLADTNIEVNTIINQVNEAQELINHPWFFYVPSAMTVDPEVLFDIDYGEGIPIGDINGIMFPSFPQTPLANLSTMDTLLMFADRMALPPQSVGSSQVRNSPRTARGTLALLSEAGIKTDMTIKACQEGGWKELVNQIHSLYEIYGPDEKFFYVTGEQRPTRITNEQLRGRFEYSFSGNTTNTNQEVLRMIAQQRFAVLSADPMYLQDLRARQALIRNFLTHWSEGINVDEAVPQLPGQGGTQYPIDQKTELKIIQAGRDVPTHPLDDDAAHIQIIDQFGSSKDIEMWRPESVQLLAIHRMLHEQQMLQKQQAGALGTSSGAANNVPTNLGLGSGGPADGGMEGGIQ